MLTILGDYLGKEAKLRSLITLVQKCHSSARLGSKPALLTLVNAWLSLFEVMNDDFGMITEARAHLKGTRTLVDGIPWLLPQYYHHRELRRLEVDANSSLPMDSIEQLVTIATACQREDDHIMELAMIARIGARLDKIDPLHRDGSWNATHKMIKDRESQIMSNPRGQMLHLCRPLSTFAEELGYPTIARADEFLHRLTLFETANPDFDIPKVKAIFYYAAASASRRIGRDDEARMFEEKKIVAISNSPPYLSELWRLRSIYWDKPRDEWAPHVMKIILTWIKVDLNAHTLDIAQVAQMLLIPLSETDPRTASLVCQLNSTLSQPPEDIANRLVGYPDPVSYKEWSLRFQRFEKWLRNSPSSIDVGTRHTILGDLQMVRSHAIIRTWSGTLGDHAMNSQDGCVDFDMLVLFCDESSRFLALGKTLDRKAVWASDSQLKIQESFCADLRLFLLRSLEAVRTGFLQDSHAANMQKYYDNFLSNYQGNDLSPKLTALEGLSFILVQRYKLFGTVAADACLDTLAVYDKLYMQERAAKSVIKGLSSLTARLEDVHRGMNIKIPNHYSTAQGMILEALGWANVRETYQRVLHLDPKFTPDAAPQVQRNVLVLLTELIEWTQRKKARSVTEALGADIVLTSYALSDGRLDDQAQGLLHQESELRSRIERKQGDLIELNQAIEILRAKMRDCPSLMHIMDLRDGRALTKSQLHSLAQDLGPDVLIVDYSYVPTECTGNRYQFMPMVYKKGALVSCQFVMDGDLSHTNLQRWIHTYLEEKEPLAAHASALGYLYPLIDAGVKHSEPGDTILVCPTDILFRIPLHAIELPSGEPWIQRNPIVYAQSLSVHRLCTVSASAANLSKPIRPLAIQALSESDLKSSMAPKMAFTSRIRAKQLAGAELTKQSFLSACAESRFIHFYGHIHYDDKRPLDQHLAIRDLDSERVTVRDLFDLRLRSGTHVNLIGCQSGRSQIGINDDLLGFSTALLYAGAASIVTALWSVDMGDASAFQETFCDELVAQSQGGSEKHEGEGGRPTVLNLAVALQKAILKIRLDDSGQPKAPYHWASFSLQGCWNVCPRFDV